MPLELAEKDWLGGDSESWREGYPLGLGEEAWGGCTLLLPTTAVGIPLLWYNLLT